MTVSMVPFTSNALQKILPGSLALATTPGRTMGGRWVWSQKTMASKKGGHEKNMLDALKCTEMILNDPKKMTVTLSMANKVEQSGTKCPSHIDMLAELEEETPKPNTFHGDPGSDGIGPNKAAPEDHVWGHQIATIEAATRAGSLKCGSDGRPIGMHSSGWIFGWTVGVVNLRSADQTTSFRMFPGISRLNQLWSVGLLELGHER